MADTHLHSMLLLIRTGYKQEPVRAMSPSRKRLLRESSGAPPHWSEEHENAAGYPDYFIVELDTVQFLSYDSHTHSLLNPHE